MYIRTRLKLISISYKQGGSKKGSVVPLIGTVCLVLYFQEKEASKRYRSDLSCPADRN